MFKSKLTKGAAIAGILAVSVIGVYAAFSGTSNTATNTFSIVSGQENEEGAATITEEHWDTTDDDDDGVPDVAEDLQPGATLSKDPVLASEVEYDAYAFMKVTIPTITATLDDVEGTYEVVTLNNISGSFTLVDTITEDDGSISYVYGILLEAGATTDALFDSITVQDFTNIDADNAGTKEVVVSAEIIQTEGYDSLEDAYASLA